MTTARASTPLTLRPYQQEALEAGRYAVKNGRRRVLVQLATGLGKTVVFAEIARQVAERGDQPPLQRGRLQGFAHSW